MMMSAPTGPVRDAGRLVSAARAARSGFAHGLDGQGPIPCIVMVAQAAGIRPGD